MSNDIYQTLKEEEKEKAPPIKQQDKKSKDIVNKVFPLFLDMETNRNRSYSVMREKNIIELVNDSQERFNNYRRKPDWKEDWQSNISDITTHTKLMAITAQALASRLVPTYYARNGRDIFSNIKASIFNSIAEYIDGTERNGQIDDLFALILAQRDGTVQAYEHYEENEWFKGVDFRFIPISEGYPGNMREYNAKKQPRYIWRTIQQFDTFKANHQEGPWQDIDLVKPAGTILGQGLTEFFSISKDLREDQVEKIVIWDKVNNIFAIVTNGVLITKPGMKLTDFRKDREIPITKGVFEPYDPHFYYGRPLPDIMKDNQDAIDFLFNGMFDRELLATMKPILVGGVNDLADDFWSPGAIKNVMDVTQVKELGFDGADLNAFRILKELQDRNAFMIDSASQGVSLGRKTATEIERANQAQRLKNALFNVLVGDFQIRKAELRRYTIKEKYLKNDKFKKFIIENTRLSNGETGTRDIRVTKNIPPRTQFGFSPQLAMENAMIKGESEIIAISDKEFKNFDVDVYIELDAPTTGPIKKAMMRDYVNQRIAIALQRPDLISPKALLEIEANSIAGLEWDKIKGGEGEQQMPSEIPSLQNLPSQLTGGQAVQNSPLGV